MHITIIGGGNLGHVMSAVLAHKNFNVILLTGDENKWNNSIEINYCDKYSFISNIRATSDFEESISNARHILLCLPGNAIRSNLYKIKEYIRDDAVIGSVVSSSGFFWMTRHILGSKNELYGFQRVPFISRITKYGDSAKITGTRSIHKIGVSSNFKSSNILSDYENALNAKVELLPNYLQAALTNSNPILHPSRMFTLFKDWSKSELYDHIPYFYEDWTCEDSENLISADNEFQNILSKLQVDMDQVPPLLNYYGVTDTKELTEKIKSIEAFKNIGTPMIKNNNGYIPDLGNRYFTEDIPYGLLIIKSLALLSDVRTEKIDEFIFWAQKLMNKEYLLNSDILGNDAKDSGILQNYGISDISELIKL